MWISTKKEIPGGHAKIDWKSRSTSKKLISPTWGLNLFLEKAFFQPPEITYMINNKSKPKSYHFDMILRSTQINIFHLQFE